MADERRTNMGLGNPPESHEDDGEQVSDEELIGPSDTEHPRPDPRLSAPRISQRLPRLVMAAGLGSEGDILVNRYRVERVVGRTAHEVVLEASHLDLGQRVLLRHLSTLASTSPEAVARFQRGARKAREMRSEHAERVVDFGRLDTGAPYRAVELPRGPSLAEILRVRGALPVAEAVDIVLTACEPVAEAHASGVVHRSLSTTNIFVERRSDGAPHVRVLDFGVSDPLEPDWANTEEFAPGAGTSVESLRFASPEQIRNPSAVDARSDVWALGAILYELIAGAPLFQADSPLTLLAMIAADTPTPLGLLRTDVPTDLEQLVLSCLEKDPDARPRSVVDMVLALSPYASAEAQPAAARVARIVMRTTRPPPLPSQTPAGAAPRHATTVAPGRGSTSPGRPSRALVRSDPPPRAVEPTPLRDARGFGMLFAGAAIGLGAAILAPRLAPPPAPAGVESRPVSAAQAPAVATQAPAPVAPALQLAPAPVATQAAVPAATPPVAPTAIAAVARPVAPASPVVAPHAPAATPQPPAAPATRPAPRPTPAPSPARAAEDARAPARTAAASPPAKTAKPSADDLFGGLD